MTPPRRKGTMFNNYHLQHLNLHMRDALSRSTQRTSSNFPQHSGRGSSGGYNPANGLIRLHCRLGPAKDVLQTQNPVALLWSRLLCSFHSPNGAVRRVKYLLQPRLLVHRDSSATIGGASGTSLKISRTRLRATFGTMMRLASWTMLRPLRPGNADTKSARVLSP